MRNMLKNILSAAALAVLVATPSLAQDEEAAPAPRPASAYATIDYNLQDDRDNILFLDLSNGKRVAIRLMPDWAPQHVERIKTLARQGFYDGVIFHRVIDLQAEFNPMPHVRGTVSMARAQAEDSANSQFFIVFYPRFSLDKKYTNFGRVIAGMDAVDAIHRGEPPRDPTRIVQASIASDNKPAPTPQEIAASNPASITADDLTAPAGE